MREVLVCWSWKCSFGRKKMGTILFAVGAPEPRAHRNIICDIIRLTSKYFFSSSDISIFSSYDISIYRSSEISIYRKFDISMYRKSDISINRSARYDIPHYPRSQREPSKHMYDIHRTRSSLDWKSSCPHVSLEKKKWAVRRRISAKLTFLLCAVLRSRLLFNGVYIYIKKNRLPESGKKKI